MESTIDAIKAKYEVSQEVDYLVTICNLFKKK
jgi:hypothetical protein